METTSLSRTADDEFAPETTYLNTSTCGLLPRRTVAAVQALAEAIATGRSAGSGDFEAVEAARAASPASPVWTPTGSPPAARSPCTSD